MKNYLAQSYKNDIELNKAKLTEYSLLQRENWIRLFVDYAHLHNCKNVLCFDETAWHKNMPTKKSWGLIG